MIVPTHEFVPVHTPEGHDFNMLQRSAYEFDDNYKELGYKVTVIFEFYGSMEQIKLSFYDFEESHDIGKWLDNLIKKYGTQKVWGFLDAVECRV